MQTKIKNRINSGFCHAALALNLSSFTNGLGTSGLTIEARPAEKFQILAASLSSEQNQVVDSPNPGSIPATLRQNAHMILGGRCAELSFLSTCLSGGMARADLSQSSTESFYRARKTWMPVARLAASTPLVGGPDSRLRVNLEASHFWIMPRRGLLEWEHQVLRSGEATKPNLGLSGGSSESPEFDLRTPPQDFNVPGAFVNSLTAIGLSISILME